MIEQGYNFHGYDDIGDHISTSFWYAVSEDGKIYDEISQLSSEDLRIARNEIFARYGYIFGDEGLKEHFSNYFWYVPTGMSSGEIESSLNNFEIENLRLIQQCENK